MILMILVPGQPRFPPDPELAGSELDFFPGSRSQTDSVRAFPRTFCVDRCPVGFFNTTFSTVDDGNGLAGIGRMEQLPTWLGPDSSEPTTTSNFR